MKYLRRLLQFLHRSSHSAANTVSVVNTSWSSYGCYALSIAKITSLTHPQEYKNGGLVTANCNDQSIGVTGDSPYSEECQFHFWILNNNDPLNRIFCLESVANGSYYLHWDKLNHKVDLKAISSDADKSISSSICWKLPTVDIPDANHTVHKKILLQAWDGHSEVHPWYLVFDFDDPQDNEWGRATSTPPIKAYLLQREPSAIQNAAITLMDP